jgi:DNA-binding transcriptional LysR family regulator
MELRVLNYFLAVAREENITKAAQSLHITQPTLSRQLAHLEEELGVKLFRRSSHNIVLTADGMILKRRAQEMLSLAEKTKKDLLRHEEALTGELALGSGEFESTYFLSELINSFQQKHPLVRYKIYSGNSQNIQDYIERGLLDIGLMTEPIDIRKYDFIPIPQMETWGVFVKADSDLASKAFVTPEDLIGRPLISSDGDIVERSIKQWFGGCKDRLNITLTGNLLYNLAVMAMNDIGVVIGIHLRCTYENLRFIPLSPPLEFKTALAWKKEQFFSPTTAAFIEHARACVKSISVDSL